MASNKKRVNEESEGGGKDLGRAKWSKETLHLFCDLCIQYAEKSKEKHGTTTSQRMAWKVLELEFQKRTNLPYAKNQLKNKWDWMKSRWSLWKALKGKETGLEWDNEKGTVSASEEWWKNKIEENMHFKAFRDEGIEPELENKMEQLFRGSVSQGVDVMVLDRSQQHVQCEKEAQLHIPCSPPILAVDDCDDEISENSACNHQGNIEWQELWNDQSPIPSPTPLNYVEHGVSGKSSKRVSENDPVESNKRSCRNCFARRVGVKMLEEKLDALVKVVTEKKMKKMELITSVEKGKLDDSCHSVADSIAKLVSIPGLIHGSPEFCFACTLIEDPQKRTILHGIPDDHSRLQWIKFLYEKHRNNLF